MRMTMQDYCEAIRAAYEEGYMAGANRDHVALSSRAAREAREKSGEFWQQVEDRLREVMSAVSPKAPHA